MTESSLPAVNVGTRQAVPPHVEDRPPGERYFRHPGDAVRLAVWGGVAAVLLLIVGLASNTAEGVTTDVGRLADRVALAGRQLLLALVQLAAIAVPAVVVLGLAWRQHWRRLGVLVMAAVGGAAVMAGIDALMDLPPGFPSAVADDTWVASTAFPSTVYVAAIAAVATVGKPWLSRSWRRAVDVGLASLIIGLALAGTLGLVALVVALAVGSAIGAAVLLVIGAPNRRPTPATVAASLRDAGLPVSGLALRRAEGGRSQLYVAEQPGGRTAFVKVYDEDSRDADLLYRGYRTLLLRSPDDDRPPVSPGRRVEHNALLLLLARRAGVAVPAVEALATLGDGSVVLALEHVDGVPLASMDPAAIDDRLLDAVWREVATLHAAHLAHRSLRAGNVLVAGDSPVLIDFGFGDESATPRLLAIDRAELLASLAAQVGVERATASAARVLHRDDLASAAAYLQPLALSGATRHQVSKSTLGALRTEVSSATGQEPPELERLIRVRPRTLVTIAALSGAFYFLLPQLASVDDSFEALRHASLVWLGVCVLLSSLTYVAGTIGLMGGAPERLPFFSTLEAQLGSSFVNRVTPANAGGMALNVRYMQKAGVEPAGAVTAIGLNVAAGGIVHLVLLVLFVTWAGQGSTSFKIPSSSTILVAIAVVMALVGIGLATRWGRRLFHHHVLRHLKAAWASLASLARSPVKLAALFGGSLGVTLAYIGALTAAVAAVDGGLSFAQVGAVYLGASVVAAAAPTPGGLGAVEAALAAGLTGAGMDGGLAVAAVLSYRLMTYWLPVLPGWIAFHRLQARNVI